VSNSFEKEPPILQQHMDPDGF